MAGDVTLLDGPVGAELVRRGVRWRKHGMLTDAHAVRHAHVDYLRAGAQLLRTNTFGLNHRIYLNVFRSPEHMAHIGAPGLDTLATRLQKKAVELAIAARSEAGTPSVPIAGVVSPLEHVFRPDLVPDEQTARREHGEIARTLAEAGAELLFLEAFTTLREARAALEAARATGLPVWISFAVGKGGDLLGSEPIAEAGRMAVENGAQAVIATGAPAEDVLDGLRKLRGPDVPLGAAPMCGRFEPPSWKFEFHPQFGLRPGPEQFASVAMAALDAGARIVGGWCGTGPEHVAALREALRAPAEA